MAAPNEQAPAPSLRHAALGAKDHTHDSTAEALTVTPACEGVYAYTVSASSEWTTTDLLLALQDLVCSTTPHGDEARPPGHASA
jgi:hypothetical protein